MVLSKINERERERKKRKINETKIYLIKSDYLKFNKTCSSHKKGKKKKKILFSLFHLIHNSYIKSFIYGVLKNLCRKINGFFTSYLQYSPENEGYTPRLFKQEFFLLF